MPSVPSVSFHPLNLIWSPYLSQRFFTNFFFFYKIINRSISRFALRAVPRRTSGQRRIQRVRRDGAQRLAGRPVAGRGRHLRRVQRTACHQRWRAHWSWVLRRQQSLQGNRHTSQFNSIKSNFVILIKWIHLIFLTIFEFKNSIFIQNLFNPPNKFSKKKWNSHFNLQSS